MKKLKVFWNHKRNFFKKDCWSSMTTWIIYTVNLIFFGDVNTINFIVYKDIAVHGSYKYKKEEKVEPKFVDLNDDDDEVDTEKLLEIMQTSEDFQEPKNEN